MQDLWRMVKALKVQRLIEDIPDEDLATMLAPFEAVMAPFRAPKERLDAFREAVGDEHYRTLAAGSSFTSAVGDWEIREQTRIMADFAEALLKLIRKHHLDADVSLDDVKACIAMILMKG